MKRLSTENSSISSLASSKYDSERAQLLVEGVFTLYDMDKSGFLKKSQFMNFFNTIIVDLGGEKPTQEDTEEVMDLLDKNGDGQISRKEVLVLFAWVFEVLQTLPRKCKKTNSAKEEAFIFLKD